MGSTFLSRFTPSLMQPETLEALFVQRHALAERIVDLIRESIVTPAKHHNLLIGPRGIGKSHLVSLIYYRVSAIAELRERGLTAWLREEEWGVTSFLDLLLRVCRALSEIYRGSFPSDALQEIYDSSRSVAERKAAALLKEFVGDKTLFLIVENLHELFKGLGSEGQKRFRSFLQENQFCTILATSQSLFSGVSLQSSPFYGFFRIHHLEELKFEEAVALVKNIASFLKDDPLASFVQTPTGRARIRAVHHLAGGNHRVYVIFSEFLTRELLDELINPFMHMLDDLTPYYQARMAWLSPQQRKIVEYLCDQRGAVSVKEIARRCFMTHQTAAGQLKILREAGYVRSEASGRESFYELREPLMRLCIELKKNRGGPIRLLVDFLRLWHSRKELQKRLIESDKSVEREYLSCAVDACEDGQEDLRIAACLKDFKFYVGKGDYESALQVSEELVAIRGEVRDLLQHGKYLLRVHRDDEALAAFDRAIESDPNDASAWQRRGIALASLDRNNEALEAFDKAINLDPTDEHSWVHRGMILGRLNQHEASLAAFDKVVELDQSNSHALLNRSVALRRLTRYEAALADLNKAIEIDPKDAKIWLRRGMVLDRLARNEDALVAFEKAVELNPADGHAWLHHGMTLDRLNRLEDALAAFDKAVNLDPLDGYTWFRRGMTLDRLNRLEDALAAFDKASDLDPKKANIWLRRGMVLNRLARSEDALVVFEKAIELDPTDGYAWLHRGLALDRLARNEEALAAFDRAVELNPNHAHLWVLRGMALSRLNRSEEALAALGKAIEIDPHDSSAWVLLGVASFHIGRKEQSLAYFDKAIEQGENSPYVFACRAEALLVLDRWEASVTALREALRRFAEARETSEYDAADIVKSVFENSRDNATLRERIKILIHLHYEYQAAGSLGEGLVRSVTLLKLPIMSASARTFWHEVWQDLAGDKPEFQLPLRLLDAAVRYQETHDDRVLLELPTEERTLLRPLLGLEETEESPAGRT